MTIIVDDVEYKVNVIYPSHEVEVEILSGQNEGQAINFSLIGDVGATRYSHRMEIEPNNQFPTDFDALFWTITAPVNSHRVQLPFLQTTQEFEARITVSKIIDHGVKNGLRRWRSMTVLFRPVTPQRIA